MKKLIRLAALLPLLALPMVPMQAAAGSVGGTSISITIQNQAALVTGGVAVQVDYVCYSVGETGTIIVAVAQASGDGSSGPQSATCDDVKHQATLTVLGAFTPGTASATAQLTAPDQLAIDQKEITIK
jgi:hypothetical protein